MYSARGSYKNKSIIVWIQMAYSEEMWSTGLLEENELFSIVMIIDYVTHSFQYAMLL